MKAEQNKGVVARLYNEVWNEGAVGVIDEIFTDDFQGHAPGDTGSVGPEGVKGFVAAWRTAFPDLHVQIDAQHADDERVATRFTCTGTHLGRFLVFPPTGRHATMKGVAVSRIVDGRIASDLGEFDMVGLLHQLGVAGPPASAGARGA
jgi:steroid delta-isomerase-like uncharacterized protein